MLGGIRKYPYLCSAKKGRDGLCHQRTKTQAGHRALSEFAKKETLRIVPQQFLTIKRDTVQLTYPFFYFQHQIMPYLSQDMLHLILDF